MVAKILIGLVILFAVLAVIGGANSPQKPRSPEQVACDRDWHACTDNAMLANSNNGAYRHAQVGCKIAAEGKARFGTPTWPWFPFGSFYPGDNYIKTGRAVLVEKDAQFQNQFGAMEHSMVVCTYDMTKDSDDGRWDKHAEVQIMPAR